MIRISRIQRRALVLALGVTGALGAANSAWSGTAGQIQFAVGGVFILRGTTTLPAKRGDLVQEGDQIQSGADGFAQLRMSDDALVSVRRDTTLKVDRYQYSGATGGKSNENDGAVLSLVKGTFRSFTGALARVNKKSYVMQTPTATIGIRGTGNITSATATSTENYTVTGSHTITTSDPSGKVSTFITTPNQNVVVQNGTVQVTPPSANITSASSGQPSARPATSGGGAASGGDSQASVKSASNTPVAGTANTGTGTDADAAGAGGASGLVIGAAGTGSGATGGSTGPVVLTGCGATDPTCATTLDLTGQTTQTGSTISAISALSLFTPDTAGQVLSGVGSNLQSNFLSWGFSTPAALVRRDASGHLTGWTYGPNDFNSTTTSFDIVSPVVLEARTQAASFSRTGIEYGRLGGSAISLVGTSSGSIALGSAGMHWITALTPTPPYLPEALTGTASYRLDGSTHPTDGTGTLGTLNNASINANFTNQSVNATVNVTVASNNWVATGTNMPMRGESFDGSSPCTVSCGPQQGAGTVSVTLNSAAAGGNLNGRFVGPNADGAMLSYNFYDTASAFNSVGGVAAFVNNGANTDPGVILAGIVGGFDAYGVSIFSNDHDVIYANNPSRVVTNAAGDVTAFDARTGWNNTVSGPVPQGMPVTIAVSGAAAETGADPLSGVKWGRWDSYTVTARPDGSVLPVSGPLHFLIAPPGIPTMPQTGTFNYALVGNTRPTNDIGGIGTLNSASLAADFSARTVSVNLNATVAGTTLNGAANNMPIDVIMFKAMSNSSLPMTVTCSGTCGTTHEGGLSGAFLGTAAQSAAVGYRMATMSASSVVNSAAGVAVFRR